jgi:hypothetical protein
MPTPSTALMKGTKVVPDPSLPTLTKNSGPPILTACGDGSTVLIANTDLINTAYVGYQSGISPAGSNTTAIGPLGTVVMDSSRDIYGVANPSVIVQLIPGGTAWTPPPASIAASISALGLAKDTSVNNPSYGPVPLSYGPAKDSTVSGVTTAVNAPAFGPAKDSTVSTVNTTLGTPAQTHDVITTLPTNISTTGVPLLTKVSNVSNTSGTVIAIGGTSSLGPFTFTQPGYEISITALSNSAGTVTPFVSVLMTWSDSVSGLIVSQEKWWLAAGNPTAQTYCGTGPSKGDTLNILLTNFVGGNTLTYSLTLTQNSRPYSRDDWRQITNNAVPTFTAPNVDQSSNILCETAPALAANGTVTRILPLFAGLVTLSYFNGAQALTISVQSIDQVVAPSAVGLANFTPAANATSNQQIALPRSNCIIVLTNAAGGANTPAVFITISESLA